MRTSRTKVKTYHEKSSSDELADLPRSERASLSLRSRSTTRNPRTYREETTDASFDESVEDQEPETSFAASTEGPPQLESAPPSRHPKQVPPRRTTTPKPKPKQTKRPHKASDQAGRGSKKRAKTEVDNDSILNSGVIPAWQTLPYHILLDIFLRASYPLLDEGRSERNDSVKWLLHVALLCRSFHEPALAALYQCPPVLPAHKAHALLSLLSQDPSLLSMNYSSKIKNLHVEVEPLLLYKSGPTLGYFDIERLIEKTPQVHTIRLYHRDDYTVGLPQWEINQSKWSYSDSLFAAISSSGIVLRSWDWNCRFLDIDSLLGVMEKQHSGPNFNGLRELKLLHVDDSSLEESFDRGTRLVNALNLLPELRRLEILDSSAVSGEVLTHLPRTIRSLTLRNCDRIWSEDLIPFLASHGTNLQELSLCHNRHLSMSFIQNLGHLCPNLEIFKMDLSMHDVSSYHDVEPHFDTLLTQSQVPSWPSKLQEIELIQLRKWDGSTAEIFFNSLVNAAPGLRDLRKLGISAILKIGWRDRATFRERWISRLEKVFLRQSLPPDPNMRSLRKRSLKPGNVLSTTKDTDEDQGGESLHSIGNGPSTLNKRQSSRLAQITSTEAETPANQSREGSPLEAENVQGMCDAVNIRIDNQRPTELQYNENDFLDEEVSGDEDWDGDDFQPAPGHAW